MKTVTLYGRKNCRLCRAALDTIEKVREQSAFEFVNVDFDTGLDPVDPRKRRYAIGLPVVEIDGEPVFEGAVGSAELRRLVTEIS